MRLLLDECIDERLRLSFRDCQTARFAGFSGLKNGDLLEAAEAAGYDVLITVDQNTRPAEPDRTEDLAFDSLRTHKPAS